MIDTMNLSLDETVQQCNGNIVSDMDGEKVMLNVEKGSYYNLGKIGGEIWDLIKSPSMINQVVQSLVTSYEVEQSECEQQIIAFLNHLYKEGLIQIVE